MKKDDAEVRGNEIKTGVLGAAFGGATYVLAEVPVPELGLHPGAAGLTALAGAGLIGGAIAHHRRYFNREQRFRRELGDDGWLDMRQYRERCSPAHMRSRAAHLRPGLRVTRSTPATEFGPMLGRLVSGNRRLRGRPLFSENGLGLLVLGPTGSGKSQYLTHIVLDWPGPAYVSTTKPELATRTGELRAAKGAIHIFNPGDLGGGLAPSTLRFDLVADCTDQQIAHATAWALVRGGGGAAGTDRADFWAGKAQEIIRCYLLAAAIQGWDMRAVQSWSHDPDDGTPVAVLEAHPDRVPQGWLGMLKSHLAATPNTRTGYFATVTSCVGFMDNPTVAAACAAGGPQLDIDTWLRGSNTVYVIAGEDKRIAPLITAFTERVFNRAKQLAAESTGHRLGLPLAMLLDEVANSTPVPLDQWATDSRGWGITVAALIQDTSQLNTCYGPDRAKTIRNMPIKIALPGISDEDDLNWLAYLAGKRTVEVTSEGESIHEDTAARSRSTNRHQQEEPVITGPLIYGMPAYHAYVVGAAQRSAVVKFEPGHERAAREIKQLGQNNKPPKAPEQPPAMLRFEDHV